MEIREIDIKRDEGHVVEIIQQNLDVAMMRMRAEKQDRVCPGIAKVGVFMEGS